MSVWVKCENCEYQWTSDMNLDVNKWSGCPYCTKSRISLAIGEKAPAWWKKKPTISETKPDKDSKNEA